MVNFPRHDHEHTDCIFCALDPRTKLISFLLAIISTILVPYHSYIEFIVILLWLSSIVLFSHKSFWFYIKNLMKIYPMIFFMTFLLPFTQSNSLGVEKILFKIDSIHIYLDGVFAFIDLNIRSILIFTSSLILISETPIVAILKTLTFMHVPKWIEATVIYMQRFIHIIGLEFNRMHLAFAARSFNMSFFDKTKAIAKMSSIYFIRLIDRSERLHLAMISRGFNGEIYTRYELNWRFIDTVIVVFNIILFSILNLGWII